MSDQPAITELVKQWIARAEDALRAAANLLTMKEDCPTGIVCYHCQQAVEKYIKALLTFRSVPFPRVHDIGELTLLLSDVPLPLSETEQALLTSYAMETRYPGDAEPINRTEAQQAFVLATGIRECVWPQLPPEVSEE